MQEEYKSELHLQSLIYQWFYNNYPQYRITSSNKKLIRCLMIHNLTNPKSKVEGAKLKGCGLTKGLPDLTILVPSKGYSALFLELKIGNEKPKKEQFEMMEALEFVGYKCEWTNTFEKAQDIIKDYLNDTTT